MVFEKFEIPGKFKKAKGKWTVQMAKLDVHGSLIRAVKSLIRAVKFGSYRGQRGKSW